MTTKNKGQDDSADRSTYPRQALRGLTEENAGQMGVTGTKALSAEDTEGLIHELRVHQIKLEMQNEELRRTEEALRRSEAKYAEVVERANDGVVVVQDEVFKLVNRAWPMNSITFWGHFGKRGTGDAGYP